MTDEGLDGIKTCVCTKCGETPEYLATVNSFWCLEEGPHDFSTVIIRLTERIRCARQVQRMATLWGLRQDLAASEVVNMLDQLAIDLVENLSTYLPVDNP